MKNAYEIQGPITRLPLTYKGLALETCISTADLEKVSAFPGTWRAMLDPTSGNYYVVANSPRSWNNGKQRPVYLHRYLLDNPTSIVDHVNGKTLDNTRDNLRPVTGAGSAQNKGLQKNSTSGIRGVSWYPRYGKGLAHAGGSGKLHNLGYFVDKNQAAEVALAWRKENMPYYVERA